MNRLAGPDPGWSHVAPNGYMPNRPATIPLPRPINPQPTDAMPSIIDVRASVFDAIGDATRRFYQDVERKARELPEPPDGYQWVLATTGPQRGEGDPAANTHTVVMEGRFELRPTAVDTDPAESDWETIEAVADCRDYGPEDDG